MAADLLLLGWHVTCITWRKRAEKHGAYVRKVKELWQHQRQYSLSMATHR